MLFPRNRVSFLAAAVLLLGVTARAGSFFPEMAPFVTERSDLAKADLSTNGILAFSYETDTDHSLKMDVKNVETGKKYRFALNPEFNNYVSIPGYTKVLPKDVISPTVALFSLPPGRYTPVTIQFHSNPNNMSGASVAGSEFTIEAGKTTSFGKVKIDFERGIPLVRKAVFEVQSTGVSIDSALMAVDNPKIASQEILRQELKVRFK
ncbi:MAG: hypothetical protein K0Q91_1984 [Fibrobacteria bacterium]|jgi:hypothetical protein|nr:hypothetical protein [Fibrobacteria bacterium]